MAATFEGGKEKETKFCLGCNAIFVVVLEPDYSEEMIGEEEGCQVVDREVKHCPFCGSDNIDDNNS